MSRRCIKQMIVLGFEGNHLLMVSDWAFGILFCLAFAIPLSMREFEQV